MLDSSGDDDREDGELEDDIEEETGSTQEISMLRVNRSNSDTDEDRDSDERNQRKSIRGRRRSSSDPVNLSLGRQDDSDDTHIDVETIGSAPNKVRIFIVKIQ